MKRKTFYPYKKIYGFELLPPEKLNEMAPKDLLEHKNNAESIKFDFYVRNRNAVTLNKTNLEKTQRERFKFEIILFYIDVIKHFIKIKIKNPSSLCSCGDFYIIKKCKLES